MSAGVEFPTRATSVEAWLSAIRMERYAQQLSGVGVADLPSLTAERCTELGIVMPGHRNRIVLAANHLLSPGDGAARMDVDAGDDERSVGKAASAGTTPMARPTLAARGLAEGRSVDLSGPLAARAQQQIFLAQRRPAEASKYNSTSTMYITSTISKPQISEMIFCVAIVLHDRICADEVGPDLEAHHIEMQVEYPFLSEDNNPLYSEPGSPSQLRRTRLRRERVRPSEALISETIKSVYDSAHFSDECVVIALIYIERLLNNTAVKVLSSTWRPIVLAAIIVAQKVFDDNCLTNADFSAFCPMFSLREINHLENRFLELLQYNVSVSASTYAALYFHVQTLCQHAATEQRTPLNLEAARVIEAKVSARQLEIHESRKARSEMEPFRLGRKPAVMN
ncbi:hypothetical protein KFE25_001092 [Diacronema lutheri]|uniref:SAM domain-containing protein n=2 Tax=Diacronema lutheri TaxID=2081491 RepID=A0A8J5XD21_DIALT|nr:hypothetical protein KFE25_001092 [Diacronema lutheri]